MPEIEISFVDQPLQTLLQAGKEYPGSNLDFSIAYISSVGVAWLQPLLKSASKISVVVGLAPINRVNALLELQDLGAEVYVYVTQPYTLFHPKIYYGALEAEAWAMIGSSNLTRSGLSLNVERNLFITGQRIIDPFMTIEAQQAQFRSQSYLFNEEIKKILLKVQSKTKGTLSDEEYTKSLMAAGLRVKATEKPAIPEEVLLLSLNTIFDFVRTTRMEHAYQMLLLLILLKQADIKGMLALQDVATGFMQFYQTRIDAGLLAERNRGSKVAEVNKPENLRIPNMSKIIMIDPFPRFERRGLLDISEDNQYLILNPALLEALTPHHRAQLRAIAISRLGRHFGEDETTIEAMVTLAIG